MSTLLARTAANADQRLVLLAPSRAQMPSFFTRVSAAPGLRSKVVADLQRLRGQVYLRDGAIGPQDLTPDGRHETAEDERAWHFVLKTGQAVTACVWYLEATQAQSLEDLRARHCALARDPKWHPVLNRAIQDELATAKRCGLRFAELGGWAVSPELRHTGDGLVLALMAFSLGRAFGGSLGLTTATVRHASATILRRLGGAALSLGGVDLPSYYDPQYGCDMELLRFDSRRPSPKYVPVIDFLKERLADVPVLAAPTAGNAAEPARATSSWMPAAQPGGAAA